jgi:CRISPR system Cascade subunit CasA
LSQDASFNLVDEPWVRIRDEGGKVREVSLLELFEQAPHIECLANDLPTQDFAILRVLLAILQRSMLPTVDDDDDPVEVWSDLWSSDGFPISDISTYLDEWRERFDLFDMERPFMQVAELRAENDEISSIKKIVADIPDGDMLFSLRTGKGVESLSYSEAARWLVHVQAFDTSGIKTGTVGDPRVKRGKSYPIGTGWSGGLGGLFFEGSTLFETMLLNFIVRDHDNDTMFSADDIPSWERPIEVAGSDERFPTGRLDLYTWQARRVRLVPRDGRVIGAVLTNGDKLEARNLHYYEPMTPWRRSPTQEKKLKQSPVYLPLTHRPDKALWRGLDSIFGKNDEEKNPSIIKPDVESWVSHLASREGGRQLDCIHLLQVHAVGFEYGTQSSVITNLIDDKVELSAFLLSHEGEALVALAKECAASTSEAVGALGNFAGDLCRASGASDDDQIKGIRQSFRSQAFFEVDAPFRFWLAGLNESSNAKSERTQWRRTARQIIRANAYRMLRETSSDAIVGSPVKDSSGNVKAWITASIAEARFNAALRKALPLEEDIETKKEEEVH